MKQHTRCFSQGRLIIAGTAYLQTVLDYLSSVSLQEFINFKIVFFSILLDAFPFILLSVIISAVLNNFISETLIQRILPKNKVFSILPACLLGMIFPLCDCAMVPITRRLVAKGVPLYTATSFMLAVPIINPVVASATAYAFNANWHMLLFRLGLALIVASLTGWMLSVLFHGKELKNHYLFEIENHEHADHPENTELAFGNKIYNTFQDASNEFFDMGKYLILGAALGAASQTFISHTTIASLAQDHVLSILAMMAFAFGISVCSSADAFIAASFASTFSPGALVAFMVFGPMIDVKNTLMLLHAFRFRFVFTLMLLTTLFCAIGAYCIDLL